MITIASRLARVEEQEALERARGHAKRTADAVQAVDLDQIRELSPGQPDVEARRGVLRDVASYTKSVLRSGHGEGRELDQRTPRGSSRLRAGAVFERSKN
jgi:hypothetical protein